MKLLRLIALGVIAVLAPILALSEQSIKAIYDRWFNACTIVFDRKLVAQNGKNDFYKVRLFVRGDGPKKLPLTFTVDTDGAKICNVSFDRDLMARNLLFHPLSVQACPGKLCSESNLSSNSSPSCSVDSEILISPFHNAFDYAFTIDMESQQALKEDDLKVYSLYPKDSQDRSVCRLEENGLFNILVWVDDWWRWTILAVMVVVLTTLVAMLRWKGGTGG